MSEKIDWSDVGNLEFCKDSGWEGSGKIVGAFPSEDGILVVVRRPAGLHVHFVVNAEGRIYDGTRVVRNKPKRVTLEEVWVVYTPEGVRVTSTGYSDTAADYAKRGYIIRHIPAEEREIECGTQS